MMPIHYQRDGRIARITLDRPEALNALDPRHNDDLAAAFYRFRDDPDVAVAIVTGTGDRAFCAGAALTALSPPAAAAARRGEPLFRVPLGGVTRGFQTWKPIIAAINGYAMGGGLEIALCCDLRVAAEHARFGFPEVRVGIFPGAGGTQRLPRVIPPALALEMILTGEPIDAREALRRGLVNRVVPLAELGAAATSLAESILKGGPLAVRAAKQAVMQGLDLPLAQGLDMEAELMTRILATEDAQEGPRAFAEKRPPRFQGH
ncbi:MAG: enoyl-CoA hydratase-related protein [Chloroflexota bacterium]